MAATTRNLAAQDHRPAASRSIRFTPHRLPLHIRRASGDHEYQLLKRALPRLQLTPIRITRDGGQWRRWRFSWINQWAQLVVRSGRVSGIEFVGPACFYQDVLDELLMPLSRSGKDRLATAHRQEHAP